MTVISCYREDCWASIELSPKAIDDLVESGDSFYCPAGHRQHFTGPGKKQRRINELEASLRRVGNRIVDRTELVRELLEEMKACPVPGCHWRTRRFSQGLSSWRVGKLVERIKADREGHLAEAHGMVQVPDDASELLVS